MTNCKIAFLLRLMRSSLGLPHLIEILSRPKNKGHSMAIERKELKLSALLSHLHLKDKVFLYLLKSIKM